MRERERAKAIDNVRGPTCTARPFAVSTCGSGGQWPVRDHVSGARQRSDATKSPSSLPYGRSRCARTLLRQRYALLSASVAPVLTRQAWGAGRADRFEVGGGTAFRFGRDGVVNHRNRVSTIAPREVARGQRERFTMSGALSVDSRLPAVVPERISRTRPGTGDTGIMARTLA